MDRAFSVLVAKNVLAGLLAALAVWGMRHWVQAPLTGVRNFVYLCERRGTGSVVYLSALATLRALPGKVDGRQ